MKSKIIYLSKIYNLVIPEDTSEGIEIFENMFVSNNTEYLLNNLISENLSKAMGNYEMKEFKESSAFFYATFSADSSADFPSLIHHISNNLDSYLTLSWLIKDNNINTKTAYLESRTDNTNQVYRITSPFVLTGLKDDKSRKDIFSIKELKALSELFKIKINLPDQSSFSGNHENIMKKISPDKSINRISRALFFLQGVRSTEYLPLKITEYCTCLESIFMDNHTELSHQLAERVAWFLGKDEENRIEIYNHLKKAYTIRSKIVHGNIDDTSEEMKRIALELDDILRQSLINIFMNEKLLDLFNGDKKSFKDFMLHLIFNTPGAS